MDSASDVLEDALNFPMSDDDWIVTVLIGGLAIIFGWILFLPIFLVQGYFVAASRETMASEDLPEWGDVGLENLFVDGLKLAVVNLGYGMIVVLPLFLLFVVATLVGSIAEGSGGVFGLLFAGVVLLWFVLGLAVLYVLPAAMVNFSRHQSLAAGFDFGTIGEVVTDRDYLVGWVIAVVVNTIGGFLSLVLFFVYPWVNFYFRTSVVHIFTRAYAGALDLDLPLADVEPVET